MTSVDMGAPSYEFFTAKWLDILLLKILNRSINNDLHIQVSRGIVTSPFSAAPVLPRRTI
jgi:hypothetical protein